MAIVIVGVLVFLVFLGLSGCFMTCYDRRLRNELAQPCREVCLCCCEGYHSRLPYLVLSSFCDTEIVLNSTYAETQKITFCVSFVLGNLTGVKITEPGSTLKLDAQLLLVRIHPVLFLEHLQSLDDFIINS